MPFLKTPESRYRLAQWLLWITPALWSVNYIVARSAPGVVAPHMLALGRWALAGLILSFLARHELWLERRGTLRAAWQYLVLGALGMLICGAWVYKGAQTTTAMNIALIYAASPVLIALGAVLWLGERFSWRQGLGVLVALSGVFHVVVKGQWLSLAQVQWVAGDGWIVLAMVSWAGYALLQKKWASPLSATARLATICMGGVLVLLPFAAWESMQADTPAWSTQATWLVVSAGLVPGIGAYWAYGFCQKMLGASRVAASLYLGPLYGGLTAWAVLGESMGWHHLMGAALILPGIYLASRQARET
ncbi:EamA family transporter [Limnohabitans sp. T6-5]|uniref:DMT family transporter n=1 Tax=Limnohabitans sp. T6-5 TaxID=1100724 RepID=UPI000D3A5437|nr:DMT family transporter [Limnohabitans sp. T6-5]PUE06791.1 EamA family transporter [Limnohabitans sp. T6-5]